MSITVGQKVVGLFLLVPEVTNMSILRSAKWEITVKRSLFLLTCLRGNFKLHALVITGRASQ